MSRAVAGAITIRACEHGFVYLGDGTRFRSAIDCDQPVTFADASIVGPQHVTLVVDEPVGVRAWTLVAINRNDVWIGRGVPPKKPRVAISGRMTGASGFYFVKAIGDGAWGGASALDAYDLTVNAPDAATTADLVSWTFAPGTQQQDMASIGLKQIALPSPTVGALPKMTDVSFALERAFDRTTTIDVPELSEYAGATASFDYVSNGKRVFGTLLSKPVSASGTATFASMMTSPPFDGFVPIAQVMAVGDGISTTIARAPAGGGNVTAHLAKSPVIDEPAGETSPSPAPITLAPGSTLRWSRIDAASQVVFVTVESTGRQSPSAPRLSWTFELPASQTSLPLFALPADVRVPFFPPGETSMRVDQVAIDGCTAEEVRGLSAVDFTSLKAERGARTTTKGTQFTL